MAATIATGVVVLALIVAGIVIAVHQQSAEPVPSAVATVTEPSPTFTQSVGPAVAFSDFSEPKFDPNLVLDGDPTTFWTSTPSRVSTTEMWIAIDMQGVGTWAGVNLTPRQEGLGFPAGFRLESSMDGINWTPIPGQDYNADHPLSGADGPLTVTFDSPVQSRYVRLFAYTLSIAGSATTTAVVSHVFALQLAEFSIRS